MSLLAASPTFRPPGQPARETRPWPGVGALSLALATVASAAGVSGAGAGTPLNVLFIMADDLGQRDLGCYGSTFYETPHLDQLAREGALFTLGYAASPVCSPTRAAVLTGQTPARLRHTEWFSGPNGFLEGVPENYDPARDIRFPADRPEFRRRPVWPAPYHEQLDATTPTLAEVLRGGGWGTLHAGKWHLGPEGSYPEDHGFDVNRGGWERGGPYGAGKYFVPYENPRLPDGPPGEHLSLRLADECIAYLRERAGQPFYINWWPYDVHNPLLAPPELVAKYTAKRARLGLAESPPLGEEGERKLAVRLEQSHPTYAAMVEVMDSAVGRVLRYLDEAGLRDHTLVVFTSDNGGLAINEGRPTANTPLRGGKGWLYEGGLRVPLLLRCPGQVAPGTVVEAPVSSVDFFPTLLSATGNKPPAGQVLDGQDLGPALRGQAPWPERSLFWHYPHLSNQGGVPGSAIRRGRWKLIERLPEGTVQLFDLEKDPGERDDLAAAQPTVVESLRRELHGWRAEVGALLPVFNPEHASPAATAPAR